MVIFFLLELFKAEVQKYYAYHVTGLCLHNKSQKKNKMSASVVIAVLASIISLLYWCTRPYKFWKATENIPSPPSLPVIGNVHQIPIDGAGKMIIF